MDDCGLQWSVVGRKTTGSLGGWFAGVGTWRGCNCSIFLVGRVACPEDSRWMTMYSNCLVGGPHVVSMVNG